MAYCLPADFRTRFLPAVLDKQLDGKTKVIEG